jgi:hypothetical protein
MWKKLLLSIWALALSIYGFWLVDTFGWNIYYVMNSTWLTASEEIADLMWWTREYDRLTVVTLFYLKKAYLEESSSVSESNSQNSSLPTFYAFRPTLYGNLQLHRIRK